MLSLYAFYVSSIPSVLKVLEWIWLMSTLLWRKNSHFNCWLVGAWPRFKSDLAKQIPKPLALSATVCGAQTEVSSKVVWGFLELGFCTLQMSWWSLGSSWTDLACSHCATVWPSRSSVRSVKGHGLDPLSLLHYYYRSLLTFVGPIFLSIIQHS